MINTCRLGHIEVCFEGVSCPVCDIMSEYDNKLAECQSQINSLKKEIDSLSQTKDAQEQP